MRDISGSGQEGSEPIGEDLPTFEDLMHKADRGLPAEGKEPDRWGWLMETVTSSWGDTSLEDTLDRILREAADLTEAGYGALALYESGEYPPLRLLYTYGLSENDAADLGNLPDRQELLGALHGQASAETDELVHRRSRRAGRSPRIVLGAPVGIGDRIIGTLYLAEKVEASAFTERDELIAVALAGLAAMAIENTRLREQATYREHWLSAASELVTPSEPDDTSLQIVADWARDLSGADAAWVVSGNARSQLRLEAVSGFDADPEAMARIDFSTSLTRCVTFSGRPLKVKNIAMHSRAVDVSAMLGREPMASALVVPLFNTAGREVAITVAWQQPVDPARLHHEAALPTLLIEQAPFVLHVARTRHEERRMAVLEDRDRIARDLHDLVIQQLLAVGLQMQAASWLADPEEMTRRIGHATDEIDAIIREVRTIVFRLGSMTPLAEPRAAVVEVVERAARTAKVRPTLRFRGPVNAALDPDLLADVLAVLTEALSNAVRHAQATVCSVEVSVDGELVVRVEDDGIGMPHPVLESGLANIRSRAEQRGGRLSLTSSGGQGTRLVWSVPIG